MKSLTITILILLSLGLAGCETMEGLGEDIENLGEAIQKKSKSSNDSSD